MDYSIIVACESSGGIGYQNDLPWHLPEEFAYYVGKTLETPDGSLMNAMILGRLTYDSIPQVDRPLSDRLNVVITRNTELLATKPVDERIGPFYVASFSDAVAFVDSWSDELNRCWILGGSYIYRICLTPPWRSRCTEVYLTRVRASFPSDVFFPFLKEYFVEGSSIEDSLPYVHDTQYDVECVDEASGVEFVLQRYLLNSFVED